MFTRNSRAFPLTRSNRFRGPDVARKLKVESLEDRSVPASTITILDSGIGTLDGFLSATDGTITTADGGTDPGTLSRAALANVGPTVSITIAALDSIAFNDLTSTLTLQSAAGQSASFSAGTGNITFADPNDTLATSNASLNFTAGAGLDLSNLSAGTAGVILNAGTGALVLTSANGSGVSGTADGDVAVGGVTSTGAVSLTSNTGKVQSAGTIQTAAQLTLSAATGISVGTQAATLQALNTTSGDIGITQVAAPSQLLTVTNTAGGVINQAAGGDINITNLGSGIQLESAAIVQTAGDGDVFLAARDFIIDPTATINAGAGITTLANSRAADKIDLGTNTVGFLSITQAELDRVLGTGGIRIGNLDPAALASEFRVTAPIAVPTGTPATRPLTLSAGGPMTDEGAGRVTATNLRLTGTGAVNFDNNQNSVDNLVADLTGAGSLSFNNGANGPLDGLTVGANIDGVTGITTAGGDVTLIADNIEVANAINTGGVTGGIVTLRPDATDNIDVGSAAGLGELNLTNTELNLITAKVLRLGGGNTQGIEVTQAITLLPSKVPTLSLIAGSDDSITDGSGAGSLSVDALRLSGGGDVFLSSTANDVNVLAGNAASGAANEDFYFVDASGFQIATVDGVTGITTPTGANNSLTLTAGGAVTQAAGAAITTNGLQLLGAGSFALNEVTNEATTLAANLTAAGTGTLNYTDGSGLSIGTVTPGDGAPATSSVNTNNSNISIDTVNGPLTVTNANGTAAADVNAGTGTVTLVAGSAAGADNALTLNANAGVTGTGGVAFFADNMSIGAAANAGTSTARLDTFDAATAINLGGADGAATLGLTSAELNQVTAGVIVVGDTLNTGDITNTAAIAPTGTQQLELETSGAILNGGGSITETRLGLTAGTGIGTSGTPVATTVSNVEATTTSGGVFVQNTNSILTIGGVNATLTGVDAAGGDISVTNNTGAGDASITVSEEVTNTGGGNITVAALNATSVAGNLNVNAAITATGGNGNIRVEAEDNLGVVAPISAVGTGTITLIADPTVGPSANAGSFTNSPTGTVTTENGDITVQAGDSISLGGAFKAGGTGKVTMLGNAAVDGVGIFTSNADGTITTEGGDVTIRGLDIDIGGAIDATTTAAADGQVFLLTSRPTDSVQLGTDAGFGITQADIDNITAAVLNIGSAATNTAGIQTTGQITLDSSKVPVLSLETAGAIVDSTGGEQTDITVQILALRAENGIGSGGRGDPGDLDVAVSNLAVANVNQGTAPTGDINIFNTGSLTIGRGIDGLDGVTNDAPLGNVTIGTGSPLIIDAPVADTAGGSIDLFTTGTDGDITQTVNGNISATGGNGNILLDTSGATTGGQITINPNLTQPFDIGASGTGDITLSARTGVTLQGVGGFGPTIVAANGDIFVSSNVGLPAGTEDIVLQASTTLATEGNITLDADPDNDCVGGAITMDPDAALIGSDPVPGAAAQNIFLNAADDITLATLTADNAVVVDSCGNILDDGDDTSVVSANQIDLMAKGRIGGAGAITPDDVISAGTTPTTQFLAAIDFALTGAGATIEIDQAAPGGNVQLQSFTSGGIDTSQVDVSGALIGAANQITLVSSVGDLTVDTAYTPPVNADALLATTNGGSIAFAAGGSFANTAGVGTTTLVASGSASASITGPAADQTAEVTGVSINLVTTGGTVGTPGGAALEVDADVLSGLTTGGGAAGGSANITDTASGVAVGQIDAGTGDVTLTSLGNNGTASNVVAVTPNDGVAEIIGNVVVIDASAAPTTGNSGQIGAFSGTALFFEVDANALTALTNNSRLWVSALGGAQVDDIDAGTNTAIIKTVGGDLVSENTSVNADVTAATVVLIGENGGFGRTATNPLDIDATLLIANVTTGSGNIYVGDTTGGLTVQAAITPNGDVSLVTENNGDLILGNAQSATTVVGSDGTVSLNVSGSLSSGAPGGVPDVTANALAILNADAVTTDLETQVSNLSANVTGGSLTVLNTSASLAVEFNGNGVTTDGAVLIRTTEDLTVSQTVNAGTGTADLVGGFAGTGSTILVNATIDGASASVAGGAGADAITVTTTGTTDLDVDGLGGDDSYTVNTGTLDGAVNITDAGGANDTVTVNGPVAGSSFVVGGTRTTVNTDQVVNYDGTVEALTAAGQAGNDSFAVTPSATLPITINGNAPTTPGTGDSLDLSLAGVTSPLLSLTSTPPAFSGSLASANRAAVTFASIETLVNPTVGLTIAKTDGQTSAVPGTGITYTITVTNTGGVGLTGVGVTDPFPVTLTGVTWTAVYTGTGSTGPASGSGDINVTSITLAAGGTVVFTVTGTIAPSATGVLSNTATVVAPGGVAVSGPTTATDTTLLTSTTDLVVTGAGPSTAQTGQTLTYTFTVTNNGPSDSTVVTLTVPVPAGMTVVDASSGQGAVTVGAGVVTATFATLATGASATVTLLLRPTSAGVMAVAGTAAVAAPAVDPTPADTTATVTTVVGAALPSGAAVGAGAGGGRAVLYGPTGEVLLSVAPFGAGFTGGVRVAHGDFNGDGVADLVVGAGPGRIALVQVLDGQTGAPLFSVQPFETTFTGGVFVAAGDLNGDGVPELVITPDQGGGARVQVYNGVGFGKIADFLGITDPSFRGGARAGVGDLNGDGIGDLVVSAGFLGGPRVAVWDGISVRAGNPTKLFNDVFVFEDTLRNGAFVTIADADGDGFGDLIAGAGPGGAPRVRALSGRALLESNSVFQIGSFFTGNPANRDGVPIALTDFEGDGLADLLTGIGEPDQSAVADAPVTATIYQANALTQPTPSPLDTLLPFPGFGGGVFVG
jgi:hypothetical protein